MTAAAAAAAADAGAGAGADVSSYNPPYEEMILTAIETLNDRKGSTTQAISNYITGNYSGLADPTILSHHLERLISKGAIKMLKFSYKLAAGSKKYANLEAAAAPVEPKKRGRPPKLLSLAAPVKKRKPGRPPKSSALLYPASIYIIPQDTDLHSDILQRFPGAAAIVLPKSLLTEKTSKNSIIIFPNVIQPLIDASASKRKKLGRPRNTDIVKRKPGRPRKNVLALNQGVNTAAKRPGRPWKIRDMLVPGISQATIDELELVKKAEELDISESVPGTEESSRLNKRKSAGRPRKRPLIEGYPPAT